MDVVDDYDDTIKIEFFVTNLGQCESYYFSVLWGC
jgi:hypothetical protein